MSELTAEGGYGNESGELSAIVRAARGGDLDRAFELTQAGIARGMRHPELFDIVAGWLVRHSQDSEATAALETLHLLAGGSSALLVKIGVLLLRLRHPTEALAAFDAAIGLQPDFARAHYERGVTLGVLGQVDEMRTAHERTIALEPNNAEALASLALIAARTGDKVQARDFARRSLSHHPSCGAANAALAIADIHDGKIIEAQNVISALLADAGLANDTWIDIAVSDAGDAFAQKSCFPQAFAAYAAVGERRRRRQWPAVQNRRAIDAVRRRTAYFSRSVSWPAGDTETPPCPVRGHVFLLGFMRSGTTLLETILASNPAICAADEREFLAAPAARFLFTDNTLDELAAPAPAELSNWRAAYWKAVQHADATVAGRVFVNKMPFNSLRLPLIARLFPDAKIILAIRDPRDVVLSCFRHRFDANQLTFEFMRLEDCARFYAASMEFVEVCRQKIPITVLEHRYEDLIADFDGSVRAVCNFVGIEWTEAMRNFTSASQVIAPRSQSAEQVRRGLYADGIGQWHRFHEQLEPVMPILAPWISRFGYATD
jgi:Flp pilus assembly protein TadD